MCPPLVFQNHRLLCLCPVHDLLDLVSHCIKRPPSANIRVFGHFYCWIVGILFEAWEFYGYDTSVHLAEETNEASEVVAKGMWAGTLATWLLSVPTLVILLFCIRDFDTIVNGTYANNFAELCPQAPDPKGATTVLILCWLDSTCGTIICILSTQRMTYAIS